MVMVAAAPVLMRVLLPAAPSSLLQAASALVAGVVAQ